MVTRQKMATPAIFVLVAIIMLAGAVTLGIVAWHLNTSANSPVAVDWGDKICKHVKNCKHENEQAVDWGDMLCNPSKNGTCGEVFQLAVDWGNKKAKP